MQRLSKIILIVLVAVAVVVAIGVVGARSYLQGEGGRAQMEEALGKALKIPVKIGKVSVTLPATIRVEGLTTVDNGTGGQPKVAAGSLHASLALRSLLAGDIEIHDVVLESPAFEWPQNAEGRWVWPSPEKKKSEPKSAESKPKEPAGRKSSVRVHGIKLERGTVEMRNAKGQPLISASGVTMEFSEVSEQQLIGLVTAGRLVWGERYVFENVRTNLRFVRDVLELDAFEAAIFTGAIRGRYEMDTKSDGQPFKVRIELSGVDLNPLAAAAGWGEGEVAGRVSGDAEVSGRTDRIEQLEGPCRLSIEGGRFKKLEVFESIARLLEMGELANFQPRETSAQFNLRDEKAFIDSLVFATDNLRISAAGVARFDGKLTLDARLSVPERLVPTIPEIARGSFLKLDDGRYGLDFKITGKTDKPKTDLAERLIGGKVQDKIGDLLGSLFGTKPEKKDNKKKDEEKRAPEPNAEKQ